MTGVSLIGYARVSTGDQDTALQVSALETAGCERIFPETASGASRERPVLASVLDYVRPGDVLVVWKFDRLARSLQHLNEITTSLAERGVGFQSITERVDTTTPAGKFVYHLLGAMAEFERDLIRERTNAGLAAARAAGRVGGRRPKLTERQVETARQMHASGEKSITAIAEILGVSRPTVYRVLGKEEA